ncbi:MAG: tandem-95 repeat protein [Candidatus Magnetomorum sp.]|nr:tandem-95 repeat protein [Candidatus Magnetomorum sp.]
MTDTFTISITGIDNPPTIQIPLSDVSVYQDAVDQSIGLTDIFTDIDNDDHHIIKNIYSNSNDKIVIPEIDGNLLSLKWKDCRYLQKNETAHAIITVIGISNGLTVTDTFDITVTGTDDPPYVANKLSDFTVFVEGNYLPDTEIDISGVFSDPDDDVINKKIKTYSNDQLVTLSLVGHSLRITYLVDPGSEDSIIEQSVVTLEGENCKFEGGQNMCQSATHQFTITVDPFDDPPEVVNPISDLTVKEDESLTINISNVFTDIDNDNADILKTLLENSNESLLTATVEKNGLRLDLIANQYGMATIKLLAESHGKYISDTFTITVLSVDDPPFVLHPVGDITVDEDAPLTIIDLTDIFSDVDNDDNLMTTFFFNRSPNLLTSSRISGNRLQLSFLENQYGTATIMITGTSNGLSCQNEIGVTINPKNDPPHAPEAITLEGPFKEAETIHVQNDLNQWDDHTDTEINSGTSHYTSTIEYTYTFYRYSENCEGTPEIIVSSDNNGYRLQKEDNGFYIRASVTGTDNGVGYPESQSVTVVSACHYVNAPPFVNTPIPDLTVDEDALYTRIDLSGVFSDIDDMDTSITQTLLNISNPDILTAVISGKILTLSFIANRNGTSTITVLGTSNGLTCTNEMLVTVNPINDPPNHPDRVSLSGIFHVGKEISVDPGPWNDNTDQNPGNISYIYNFYRCLCSQSEPERYSEQVQSSSSPTYIVQYEDRDQCIKATVTGIDDAEGLPLTRCVTVHSQWMPVTNAAPRFTTISPIQVTMDEDGNWQAPSIAFNDPDEDWVTWSLLNDPAHGTAAVNGTNESYHISYTPDANWNSFATGNNRPDYFEIQISDGLGGSDTTMISITVNPINDSPNAGDVYLTEIRNRVLKIILVDWNDFTDLRQGTLRYQYQWKIADDQNGTNAQRIDIPDDVATYSVSDSDVNKYFCVAVTAFDTGGEDMPGPLSISKQSDWYPISNNDPWFERDTYGLPSITEDSFLASSQINNITAIELDPSDRLTFEISTHPQHGIASVDGTGTSGAHPWIGYTPNENWFGDDYFYIKVMDQLKGTHTTQITIQVKAVNDPPTIDTIPDLSINEDDGDIQIPLMGISAGPKNEKSWLDFTFSSIPPNLIDSHHIYNPPNITGELVIRPITNANGTATITVHLKDQDGTENGGMDQCETSFQVNILPVNDCPSFESTYINTTVSADQASGEKIIPHFVYDIDAGAPDEINDPLHFFIRIEEGNSFLFKKLPEIRPDDGALLFTPSDKSFGQANMNVWLRDGNCVSDSKIFTITINSVIIQINTDIPEISKNYEVDQDIVLPITIIGGQEPYTYSIRGALPTGLQLIDDEIKGTFVQAGTFSFMIHIEDDNRQDAYKQFKMKVDPKFQYQTQSLSSQMINANTFSVDIKATGGTPKYAYKELQQNLPDMFSFNSDDWKMSISGDTIQEEHCYTFVLMTTDMLSREITHTYSLCFVNQIKITTDILDDGIVDKWYDFDLKAEGGMSLGSNDYSWSLVNGSVLPSGLTLEKTGRLFGIPKNIFMKNITFRVTDKDNHEVQKTLLLIISNPLRIQTVFLPNGLVDHEYTPIISIAGGRSPFTFSIIDTGFDWIDLDDISGALSGTPDVAQKSEINVKVTDITYPTHQSTNSTYSIIIVEEQIIERTNLPDWREKIPLPLLNDDTRFQFIAHGCDENNQEWSIEECVPGITIDPHTGALSGTPEEAGTYWPQVRLTCKEPKVITDVYRLPWTIDKSLKIETNYLQDAMLDEPYCLTLSASGGNPEYYFWSTNMNLASMGLSLSPEGLLCGTPEQPFRGEITIHLKDDIQNDADSAMTSCSVILTFMIISEKLVLTPTFAAPAKLDRYYSQSFTVTGGNLSYSWNEDQIDSVNIPGLSFSFNDHKDTIILSGMPEKAGEFNFMLQVIDGYAKVGQTYKLHVNESLKISPTELEDAIPEKPYSDVIILEKLGIPPYTYKIIKGALPCGLSLNSETGQITGTLCSTAEHSYVNVEVTDSTGLATTDSEYFHIFVYSTSPDPEITTSRLQYGLQNRLYISDIKATGGVFSYQWSIDPETQLPEGLSVTKIGNTARITGIPLESGTFYVRIQLTDANSRKTDRLFEMTIFPNEGGFEHFTESMSSSDTSVVFLGEDITVNGVPAEVGDEIGVFDNDGTLCGRTMIYDAGIYAIKVYGDDPSSTNIDDGAEKGNGLTFKLWINRTNLEISLSKKMFDPQNTLWNAFPASPENPPQWTDNDDQWGLNIAAVTIQEIPLTSGWNLFSFSINKVFYTSTTPPTVATLSNAEFVKVTSLNDVLQSISGKYQLIRNVDSNTSHIYNPLLPDYINNLHYLAAGYGYWIKMYEPGTFVIAGTVADASSTLLLREGWNLIGCWAPDGLYSSSEKPDIDVPNQVEFIKIDAIKTIFNSLDGKFTIIRGFDRFGTTTYNPNLPPVLNNLKYISPGYGYWIKLSEPKTLHYKIESINQ